jgi:hypothetical protein
MSTLTSEEVEELYLDYSNNFLTLEGFASHYDLSLEDADHIIIQGRELNHERGAK